MCMCIVQCPLCKCASVSKDRPKKSIGEGASGAIHFCFVKEQPKIYGFMGRESLHAISALQKLLK